MMLCVGWFTMLQRSAQGAKYIGCYRDKADRDLRGALIRIRLGNTPRKCINLCKSRGFTFAGVQAGYACLCGNSYGKHGSFPESKCQKSCTGDKTQKCGGDWANAVYKVSSHGAQGADYIGCYRDKADRDLRGALIRIRLGNTPRMCINLCKSRGFTFAGVQAGYACLCGNSYGKHGFFPESKCQTSCTGDKTQKCGGDWANAVYKVSSQDIPGAEYIGCYKDTRDRDLGDVLIREHMGNTPQKCINLCKSKRFTYAGVQAGYACLCGNSYGKHGSFSESRCQTSCTGEKTQTCGGDWANAIYKVSKPVEPGANYIGCYKDTKNRDLAGLLVRVSGNTPQSCIRRCKNKGFTYAGVQAGYACLCGNSYGKYGSIPQSRCKTSCTGDKTQTCGGDWANAIYKTAA